MKYLYIDFEFNRTAERKVDVVSVAYDAVDGDMVYRFSAWLYGGGRQETAARLKEIIEGGAVIVAYAAEAEARAMMSLDLDGVLDGARFIDLYVEYRNLLNHNNALSYGEQLIDGKVIETTPPPPKWERADGVADDEKHHKPSYSLAAATYKLLGVTIDTEEKDEIRNLIISADREMIEARREDILRYNESDIKYLRALHRAICATHCQNLHGVTPIKKHVDAWTEGAISRGRYSYLTAKMVTRGYPINLDKLKKFESNVDRILLSAARECNLEASVNGITPFKWNRDRGQYSVNEADVRQWVAKQKIPSWRKTPQKSLSLSKDAFGDWFNSQSPGFAGAFCRYLKTKQSLNGFLPRSPHDTRERFRDFIGEDGRARPYFGIYGSQSSRSQPGARGFIPLKAHWMRNFIEAPNGMALCGIDYSSQEFLIAACLSQDTDMLDAYASGDVYLAFGKSAGLIPKDGTKKTHPVMREVCKQIILGISYDMTEKGLAPRMTRALGKEVTEDDAKGYIDLFYETYSDYTEWKIEIQKQYAEEGHLSLPDGWVMWGDNDNRRSVGNFPVQGMGAVIMRKAVAYAEAAGCRVLYTLHDSLVIEFECGRFDRIATLQKCMAKAFEDALKPYGKTAPIRLEGETWSKNYTDKTETGVKNVVAMSEYSDDKGKHDLERYRKFFT